LEKYYLLITVNRFKFSAQWYLLLIKFVDVFFGFHQYRRLMLPSVRRVAGYTFCTTAIIFFVLGRVDFVLLQPFPFLFALPGNFLFDYLNFLKTRLLVFRYELTHLAAPASKPTPAPRRRPLRQSKASHRLLGRKYSGPLTSGGPVVMRGETVRLRGKA
jgi:hypothetical protein